MFDSRCCPLLLLLLLALLLGVDAGEQLGPSRSKQPSYLSSNIRSRLSNQQLQCHHRHRGCTERTDHLRSSASTLDLLSSSRLTASYPLDKPFPPSITPDASWLPGQALMIHTQLGYWYVAWGQGVNN